MDNAEVITVNSSPSLTVSSPIDSKDGILKYTYKTDSESNKTSCKSERVPVSWGGNKHNIHSFNTKSPGATPSPKSKVTNWLNNKKTNSSSWSQVSVVTAPPRFVTEYKKSAILARHDFVKSFSISDCSSEIVPKYTPCSSATARKSSEVFERHNVFHIKTNCSDLPKHGMYEIENAVPSPSRTRINLINNNPSRDYNIFVKNSVKTEVNKPAGEQGSQKKPDTPLSPESVKKKELCSYLQLVNLNVANHKEITPIQNRRSIRVKNNLLLTEKKELGRKLNGEDTTASTSDQNASQMSFEEIFGDNSPQIKTEDATLCCIPKELLEKREDFDDFAKEFFNRENVHLPQRKKQKQRKLLLAAKRRLRQQFFKSPIKKRNGAFAPTKKRYKTRKNGVKRLLKTKNKTKRKHLAQPENSGDVTADVVMQDHDYICNDKTSDFDETPPKNDCDTSPSSLSPCLGFNTQETSETLCNEVNKLYHELSEFLQKEPFSTDVKIEFNLKEEENHDVDIIDSNLIPAKTCEYVALDPGVKPKSLHQTLGTQRARKRRTDPEIDDCYADESPSTSKQNKNDKRSNTLSHSISTSKSAGAVVNAFYRNFNLIVVQEFQVTFWGQSALGNILGAHNMWLQKGQVSRLVLDSGCVQKDSNEMVISLENSVAYVELWTKEHKSDKREIPVADVFAALYFSKLRQNGVCKKVLQLENIKSSAEDVRYIVMQNSRNIIVSWRMVRGEEKMTVVRCYHLAADYQTVEVIKEIQSVEHYVSSLHNIEGSDDLIMAWGENMVTLWNVEYGYIIATVQIIETMPLSSPLHVKCDRGFLFLLQQLENKNICLLAINGLNQSWKRLQTFVPPHNFEKITGVYLDDGLLVAFYANGVLAWQMNSGELRVEEEGLNCDMWLPSGKHVIMFAKDRVYVRYALALLIASDDFVGNVDDH